MGSYPLGASPYGVMDMAGNVQEWTADVYEGDYYARMPSVNPYNTAPGRFMIMRGGGTGDPCELNLATFLRENLVRSPDDGASFRCAGSATATSIYPQSWGEIKNAMAFHLGGTVRISPGDDAKSALRTQTEGGTR